MNARPLNPFPQLLLLLHTDPKPLISFLHSVSCHPLHLLHLREAHHQLRTSKRQLIPSINLPEMVRFAIQSHDLLHFLSLRNVPRSRGNTWVGHNEHSRFYFEVVTVPQSSFAGVEGDVEGVWNHVLDANEASGVGWRVVYEALANLG